jgi:hypothetical protein
MKTQTTKISTALDSKTSKHTKDSSGRGSLEDEGREREREVNRQPPTSGVIDTSIAKIIRSLIQVHPRVETWTPPHTECPKSKLGMTHPVVFAEAKYMHSQNGVVPRSCHHGE